MPLMSNQLPLIPVNQLQFAPSIYSPGQQGFPSPVNNYGTPPVNYGYGGYTFGNNNYYSTPQPQESGGGSIISPDLLNSGAKDFGQFVSNGFSIPQSSFINSVGTSLGFAPGSVTYATASGAPAVFGPPVAGAAEVFGPAEALVANPVSGSLGTSATLSSTLGAAGLGALAGSFLGRIGGNSTGGSIGGAVGAAIGNMIVPGIGGVVGGLIGGIGGGFFGGKPGTNADSFFAKTDAMGKTSAQQYTSKNPGHVAGFARGQESDFSKILQDANKELGIDFNGLGIGGGISTRHPGPGGPARLYVDDYVNSTWTTIGNTANNYYNPDDKNSVTEAYRKAFIVAANARGYTDNEKLNQWFDSHNNPQGSAGGNMPNIPLTNTQFADYMAKFNQNQNQGT